MKQSTGNPVMVVGMELIAGSEIGLKLFLGLEEENPLGIFVFHEYGANFISLDEFINESLIDMGHGMIQRYAKAFKRMEKQLNGQDNAGNNGRIYLPGVIG